jgi:outer membrane protein
MRRIIISTYLLTIGLLTHAQTQPQTQVLNYKQAIKMALQNNVTLNQQKNTLFSREVQRNQAIAAFGPVVNIQGQATRNIGQQANPENGNLENLTIDRLNTSLNAQITLFNGLTRINSLKQSTNQFKAQTAFVNRTEQDVMYNVTTQFLQVLLDQELLKIAEENFKTQQTVLDQIREYVNVGARAETDLYNQDAQTKNMEVTALRAKVTLNNDKALLSQTLQLDPSVAFEVEFPKASLNSFPLEFSLDSLYSIALTTRQDLVQANRQADANLYLYKASANGYYPNVTAFYSYGSNYFSNLKDIPTYGSIGNQFKNVFPNTTYGLNLTIPIFSRLQNRSQRVFNRVTYENSKLQRDFLEKSIKIDVQRAYNNYMAAIKNYSASQAQLQSGELALKTQQESYLLGVANQVTLAQANQTYVQAASSKAQAEVTLIFQEMLIEYALGTLKFDNLPDN